MKKLSIKELFSFSWKDFKKNWIIAIIAIIPIAISEIINGSFGLQYSESTGVMSGSILITILFTLFSIFIMMGLVKIYLNIVDQKKATFLQNFKGAVSIKHFLMYILTYFTSAITMLIPVFIIWLIGIFFVPMSWSSDQVITLSVTIFLITFVVAIIVGIYLLLSLQFAYYFSVENRYHFIDALKKSWSMTKGHKLKLLLLLVISVVLIITPLFVGGIITGILSVISPILSIILGVGLTIITLLITVPLTMLLYSHTYRKLDPEILSNENSFEKETE